MWKQSECKTIKEKYYFYDVICCIEETYINDHEPPNA